MGRHSAPDNGQSTSQANSPQGPRPDHTPRHAAPETTPLTDHGPVPQTPPTRPAN